jgi:hypothetical protein
LKNLPAFTADQLRELCLTEQEWRFLQALRLAPRRRPTRSAHASTFNDALASIEDVCILAGLAERPVGERQANDPMALTAMGEEAMAVMDSLTADQRAPVFWNSEVQPAATQPCPEEPSEAPERPVEAAPPSRTTVGSLVRHKPSGAIGIVTEQSMWDGEWGAFRAMFARPTQIGRAVVSTLVDRADRWENVG